MKTAAIGIDSKRIDNEPDLELTAAEMMVVHRWLAMAMTDITQQLAVMKPPAIMSKAGKAQVATTILGTKFLRNWLDANLQQIEGALEAAGVMPDVVLTDELATTADELN
jgi:hypothetical protein